ncbi:porin [Algibacillus agarilyticus]|uniref:porin n=1 Tax=Algibacillus agarilyticus TaxID=2234133 RepID=UPI000DD0DA70|nr:porin [Algibacillus agarilyticus]
MKNKILLSTLASALLCSFNAAAELEFRGFASVVGGIALDSDQTLRGYKDELSFKPESLFAIQASSDLGEGLSATTQLLARGNNDFDVEMEWAYITYQISNTLKLNAGKLRVPFYRYSDFLDVGFSYNWVKPPQLVYNLPFSTYEGLSLVKTGQVSVFDYMVQGFTGSYSSEDINVDSLSGINLTLEYDEWLSLRSGYIVGDVTFDASLGSLSTLLQAYGLTQAENDLKPEKDDGTFFGIGGKIDYNDWLAELEYTELEVADSLLAVQKRSYLSVGRRFERFIVLATFEKADDEANDAALFSIPLTLANGTPVVEPTSGLPVNTIVDQTVLNNAEIAQLSDAKSWSLGVRYDLSYSAALKVEYTNFEQENRNLDVSALRFGIDLMF